MERREDFSISVLAITADEKCDLLKSSRFSLRRILPGDFMSMGKNVLKQLKVIQPNYVEYAEYLGLCMESILYKKFIGKELKNTVFSTNNHTASRECFEWSAKLPLELAPCSVKSAYMREKLQMLFSDFNSAPSSFLARYVEKNYFLPAVKVLRHPVKVQAFPKDDNKTKIEKDFDLSQYAGKFVVTCLTRIEGRKNQAGLVNAFAGFLENTSAKAVLLLIGNSSRDEVTGRDMRESVFSEVPQKYWENIQFFDFVGDRGKRMFFSISDVTVLASPFENFPVAMTECICAGVPVITSKYCGCADFMQGIEDKTVFDPFAESDLEEKIEKFYALSDSERRRIAEVELRNMTELVSPENSIDKKLLAFGQFTENKRKIAERKFVFLSELSEEHCGAKINLVLGNDFFDAQSVSEFFNGNMVLPLFPENSIVATGSEIVDLTATEALYNKKMLILFGFEIGQSTALPEIERHVAEFVQRGRNFYYLPFFLKERTDEKTELLYKHIIDICFINKNKINLEDLL